MYPIRITLILTYLLILIGCTDNNNNGTSTVLTPPDPPLVEYHWQFVRLSWEHEIELGELQGYYVLFTNQDSLSIIDFVTGNTTSFVVSLPPANYGVEVYTLDINSLISEPAYMFIDKANFAYYGGYRIDCTESEGVSATLNTDTDPSGVGYYFTCLIN